MNEIKFNIIPTLNPQIKISEILKPKYRNNKKSKVIKKYIYKSTLYCLIN